MNYRLSFCVADEREAMPFGGCSGVDIVGNRSGGGMGCGGVSGNIIQGGGRQYMMSSIFPDLETAPA
jgi:hypothetical protein